MDGALRLGTSMSPSHEAFGRENAWKTKVAGAARHEEGRDSEVLCVKELPTDDGRSAVGATAPQTTPALPTGVRQSAETPKLSGEEAGRDQTASQTFPSPHYGPRSPTSPADRTMVSASRPPLICISLAHSAHASRVYWLKLCTSS